MEAKKLDTYRQYQIIDRLYAETDAVLEGNVQPMEVPRGQRHAELVEDVSALLNCPQFGHIIAEQLRDFLQEASGELIKRL